MGTADGRRSGRAGDRHCGRWRGHHRARRRADGNDRPPGFRLDAQDVPGAARVTRRLDRSPARRRQDRRKDGQWLPRAAAGRRGGDSRDRQSYRTDSCSDRRLQLRAKQVQSRDAGLSTGRIRIQADRLHRCDRSRIYPDQPAAGRAGELQRRRRAAALQPDELRPDVRR